MSFLVFGINARTTPAPQILKVVENFESNLEAFRALAVRIKKAFPGAEASLVSTCLRFEALVFVPGAGEKAAEKLVKLLEGYFRAVTDVIGQKSFFSVPGAGAVLHLYSVMAGFESEDVGEIQVLGQIKDAFKRCADAGCAGPAIYKLMSRGIACVQKIRDRVPVFADRSAISGRIIKRVESLFTHEQMRRSRALFAGRSSVFTPLAKRMEEAGFAPEAIVKAPDARKIRHEDLEGYAVIISNLQDPGFAAGTEVFRRSKARRLLVDLSVCRNFSPDTGGLENVDFLTIDDLTTSGWDGSGGAGKRRERRDFMLAARRIVAGAAKKALEEAAPGSALASKIAVAQKKAAAGEFDKTLKKMKSLSAGERDSILRLRDAVARRISAELFRILKKASF